jgi:cold shock CspA family protein
MKNIGIVDMQFKNQQVLGFIQRSANGGADCFAAFGFVYAHLSD